MSEKQSSGHGRGHKISPVGKGNMKIAYSPCPKSDPDAPDNFQIPISASTQNGNYEKIFLRFFFFYTFVDLHENIQSIQKILLENSLRVHLQLMLFSFSLIFFLLFTKRNVEFYSTFL
jgi:hypothetical protein